MTTRVILLTCVWKRNTDLKLAIQELCFVPRFCICCFNVVSMLLSKRFKHLAFPGFRVLVHVACMLCPCCIPKRFKHLVFPQIFASLCMLLSCGVHVAFRKVSRTLCFPRVLCILLSCCVHAACQNVKNLVFSHIIAHQGFCAFCFHNF